MMYRVKRIKLDVIAYKCFLKAFIAGILAKVFKRLAEWLGGSVEWEELL